MEVSSPEWSSERVRVWRWLTLLTFGACALAAILALCLDLAGFVRGHELAVAQGWTGVLPGLAIGAPGALLLWRRPGNRVAVILLVTGLLWSIDGLASAWVNISLATPGGLPATGVAYWLFERFGAWLLVALQLVLVLFPDGRLPRGGWKALAVASTLATSLLPLLLMVAPAAALADASEPIDPRLATFAGTPFELALPESTWAVLIPLARLGMPVGMLLAVVLVAHRRRVADEVGRAQLRWLLWGSAAAAVGLLSWFLLPQGLANLLSTLGIAAFSASILIAITRYRLYEIDGLIGWTLVSALLAAAFFVIDGLLLAFLGVSGPAGPIAAVSALAVGALYLPLRERVRRLARRLVSGRREEPFEVLLDLTDRLEQASTAEEQLEAVADTAREAFLAPKVVLTLQRASGIPVVVECGDHDVPLAESYPVQYRGRQLATLEMATPRRPRLSPGDRRLLDGLLSQAISAIRLGEAHEELSLARANLVTLREDERLSMRRELHDGLGPLLAGIVLRLDSVHAQLEASERLGAAAKEAISIAADDASHAVDEVRRVAHGLRPAVLTELGVKSAIEQQCMRLSAGGIKFAVGIDLPGELPAAVEVAAYRIVSEAATNIVRHSGAARAEVTVSAADGAVLVRVDDDGCGTDPGTWGHGLDSQRMRAEELGGHWQLGDSPLGGTRVIAEIPLRAHNALLNER